VSLAELRAKYPLCDIWHVPVHIGPDAWCVKPKGSPIATHREDSPEALDKWLADRNGRADTVDTADEP
jgi:hypothetical protein